jgi:predicted nucleic acid-binding protein
MGACLTEPTFGWRLGLTSKIIKPAVGVAVSRGLTVYDASYALPAEAEDAVLFTADRRLAAAVPRAELV